MSSVQIDISNINPSRNTAVSELWVRLITNI